MIKLDRVMKLCFDNREHEFVFVAKGTRAAKRAGGYIVRVKGIVTSTNFFNQTMNILIVESGETRKFYSILMLEYEQTKVIY